MQKPPKYWCTRQDSNLWPLPSEGLCNDGNAPFSVNKAMQTTVQAHVKPFLTRIVTGATPDQLARVKAVFQMLAICAAMGVV